MVKWIVKKNSQVVPWLWRNPPLWLIGGPRGYYLSLIANGFSTRRINGFHQTKGILTYLGPPPLLERNVFSKCVGCLHLAVAPLLATLHLALTGLTSQRDNLILELGIVHELKVALRCIIHSERLAIEPGSSVQSELAMLQVHYVIVLQGCQPISLRSPVWVHFQVIL